MINGNALRDGLPRAGRPAFTITKTSEAVCVQDARQRVAVGGQTSLPWWLSRSVIDSVGLAGTEFAQNAESDCLTAALPPQVTAKQIF
jgi:hypothetical protein